MSSLENRRVSALCVVLALALSLSLPVNALPSASASKGTACDISFGGLPWCDHLVRVSQGSGGRGVEICPGCLTIPLSTVSSEATEQSLKLSADAIAVPHGRTARQILLLQCNLLI